MLVRRSVDHVRLGFYGHASSRYYSKERRWVIPRHQREFLDSLGISLGFKQMEDWYNIRYSDLEKEARALLDMYGGSPIQILKSVYKEYDWLPWRFKNASKGCWDVKENQRKFMDQLGKDLGFNSKEDWYRINGNDVIKHGGSGLLEKYGKSPSKLLKSVYPEHVWFIWKFEQVPNGYWERIITDRDECLQIVENLAKVLKIEKLEDWYRVSHQQILKFVPWNDLHKMLPEIYPQHKWDEERLQNRRGTMKASQRMLELSVKELFPNDEVKTNYQSEEGIHRIKTNRPIEMDVYVPAEKLAFEYQGEQHYHDIYSLGNRWQQKQTDEEKKRLCMEKGITLIEVPYWWDKQTKSLAATIRQKIPDLKLLASVDIGDPIPEMSPKGFPLMGTPGLMHSEQWNGVQDLQGWWMSEKMDGIRGYWDGKEMWSRHSKKISCPSWFTQDLPHGVALDGELWMGRKTFEDISALLNSSAAEHAKWKDVRYIVFDLPGSKKLYEERMEELKGILFPHHVNVVEIVQCKGNLHMMELLRETVDNGGEGLMLVKPGSAYVDQRTENFLKVKIENDCEVQILEVVPSGLYCQRTNGVECTVGCHQQIIDHPPEIGSVITVKHNGLYQNGALRNPFFWRLRSDVEWESISKSVKPLISYAKWTDPKNIRRFFDEFSEVGSSLEHLYTLQSETVRNHGATALLNVAFDGSISKVLKCAYPNHEWLDWKFVEEIPNGFWNKKANQKRFMDWLSKRLKIEKMEDWYKFKRSTIEKEGGGTLIKRFQNSYAVLLSEVYPEHPWDQQQFTRVPKGYWNSADNQREFMESVGQELGFKTQQDWYKISKSDLERLGGSSLLKRCGGSPAKVLEMVFPEKEWNFVRVANTWIH